MSDDELIFCHNAIMTTKPITWGPRGWLEYWDEAHKITMEDWADHVRSEVDRRGLRQDQQA